jgi:hypothetical protein
MSGSCLCGAIRYQIDSKPDRAHNCYCGRCRKVRGAAFASNLFVAREFFSWAQGEDRLRSFKPPKTKRFQHVFCTTCGSSMPALHPEREIVVVPMGSLDCDPEIAPQAHIFVDSKASWVTIRDDLPQYERHTDSARLSEKTD